MGYNPLFLCGFPSCIPSPLTYRLQGSHAYHSTITIAADATAEE